jgi:hypothetical protein
MLPPFERSSSKDQENQMAFKDLQSELGFVMTRMQNEPHDRHELYLLIRQKLNEIKACGMPLPDDLVQFERRLEAEFEQDLLSERQGIRKVR